MSVWPLFTKGERVTKGAELWSVLAREIRLRGLLGRRGPGSLLL